MMMRFVWSVFLCFVVVGCGPDQQAEQQAERMLVTTRDLEEELDDLPKAIARYAEIIDKYPNTEATKTAKKKHEQLTALQTLLAGELPEAQDSLVAFYESATKVAPGYLALIKKLGIIYYNQTFLAAPAAVKTRLPAMKDRVVEIWEKQDALWQTYSFRPVVSDRLWQDRLCRQAIGVADMLLHKEFGEFDRAYDVVQDGLRYGNSEDIRAKANVVAGFCAFRKGKKENLKEGIKLSEAALAYEFLEDEDRARAYHVIGLCYTYLHQDSGEMADLDAAIKALNECVNIDKNMADARDLLKTLRQIREKLPS